MKLYTLVTNRELAVATNDVLDTKRIRLKILAFIDSVSELGEQARVYTFWHDHAPAAREEMLETYVQGMTMLMSVGFDMRIDSLKQYEELPGDVALDELMFRVYDSALKLKSSFSPIDLENTLDDYFHLGFALGFTIDEVVLSLNE